MLAELMLFFTIFYWISQLLKLISPKQIKLQTSTWALFKEQTQLFKMSPSQDM